MRNHCIRAAILIGGIMVLTGCQKSTETVQEVDLQQDSISETPDMEDRQGCPLNELFAYLEEEGEGSPYVYAQIFITLADSEKEDSGEENPEKLEEDSGEEESLEDSYDEYRQDIVYIEGLADISWQTFAAGEEFQEYFSIQENEEDMSSSKEGAYDIEFAYYQYQLPEGIHAIDVRHFLKERYDRLYAISISERQNKNAYILSQSNECEIVVIDNVLYGLECRGIADEIKEDDIWTLLMAYSTQKQKVETYDGWVMHEETLYWFDHDERVTSLEDPTRIFTEVKAIDTNWSGTFDMENFGLLKEADYQIRLWEDGPLLQIHFGFAGEIPTDGYEIELLNGCCICKDYEMTVVNQDTNELLQSRKVPMSVEMPDMITFADLDMDGYLDMQIDYPTHWSGERAIVDEFSWPPTFMLWNAKENIFELRIEEQISLMRTQNQEETACTEYVVQPGDTLWGISRRFYGTGTRYTEIEERNMEVLSGHKYLMPGMTLRISD